MTAVTSTRPTVLSFCPVIENTDVGGPGAMPFRSRLVVPSEITEILAPVSYNAVTVRKSSWILSNVLSVCDRPPSLQDMAVCDKSGIGGGTEGTSQELCRSSLTLGDGLRLSGRKLLSGMSGWWFCMAVAVYHCATGRIRSRNELLFRLPKRANRDRVMLSRRCCC